MIKTEQEIKIKVDSKQQQEKRLLEFKSQLDKLKDMLMKGFIEDSEFSIKKEEIENEIDKLNKQTFNVEEQLKISQEMKRDIEVIVFAKKAIMYSKNLDEKKNIVKKFGDRHTILNKKFYLVTEDWMLPVLTCKKIIDKNNLRLEPTESIENKRKTAQLSTVIPVLGAHPESNRDSRNHNPK